MLPLIWSTATTLSSTSGWLSPKFRQKLQMRQKFSSWFWSILRAKGEKVRKHRKVIRQTWGNRSNCEQRQLMSDQNIKHLRWLLVFVVGKAGQGSDDDQLNLNEARRNNDMLIGNIEDNYINNIIKFYMGHIWASQFGIKYTLKVDDDVYVRIPGVLKYLVKAKFPKPFYGGSRNRPAKVIRDRKSKWGISWKYYEEKTLSGLYLWCVLYFI